MNESSRTRRRALGALGALGASGTAVAATGNGFGKAAVRDGGLARKRRGGDSEPFSFGFIGDTPYNWLDEQALQRVMDAMAAEPLAFVLHAGDIKSSGERCSDGLLSDRIALLDASAHPLILTPGDNEWTDCWRARGTSGEVDDTLERLQWLRRRVYALPRSLGRRTMAVEQQTAISGEPGRQDVSLGLGPARGTAALPENLRWRMGGIRFCTLHVVGSNNGLRRTPALRAAWDQREAANIGWLRDTVDLAIDEGSAALVVALHANMRFERDNNDGWSMMRRQLLAAARRFPGPVLHLHGDTHWFREGLLFPDRPDLANLHRVECHGSPFTSSWVSIRWNPAALELARPDPRDIQSRPFVVSARQV